MSAEPISQDTRTLLTKLSSLLLDQHKLLLDLEKAHYEAAHGSVGSPGQYLNLVIGDPHFAWLKTLSTLVVEIDEALSRRSKAGQAEAEALVAQVRAVTGPFEGGGDFQERYRAAMEGSTEVVVMQGRIAALVE